MNYLTREGDEHVNSQLNILIPLKIWNVLTYLAKERPNEWQCFAKVEKVNSTTHKLTDIRFPKQSNSSASTESDEEAMAEFLVGLDDDKENPQDWKCWIHSHNTMAAFWSATDQAQMENFKNSSYMLSIVINAERKYKACINMFSPVKYTIPATVLIDDNVIDVKELEKINEQLDKLEVTKSFNLKDDDVFCAVCGTKKYSKVGYCWECKRTTANTSDPQAALFGEDDPPDFGQMTIEEPEFSQEYIKSQLEEDFYTDLCPMLGLGELDPEEIRMIREVEDYVNIYRETMKALRQKAPKKTENELDNSVRKAVFHEIRQILKKNKANKKTTK